MPEQLQRIMHREHAIHPVLLISTTAEASLDARVARMGAEDDDLAKFVLAIDAAPEDSPLEAMCAFFESTDVV